MIDATLADGALSYGECLLPGESTDEVLVSAHVCHPSLTNDNLSGIVVAAELARHLAARPRRYSYRFLFVPAPSARSPGWRGTRPGSGASAMAWSRPISAIPGACTTSAAAGATPRSTGRSRTCWPARTACCATSPPYGYDERQFCSPGFDLPVGCLSRTPWGEFPEYHSSADDLALIRPAALAQSLATFEAVFDLLERNRTYLNLAPKGEPQLGRRGLYAAIGGGSDARERQMALLWILSLADGSRTCSPSPSAPGSPSRGSPRRPRRSRRTGCSRRRIHEGANRICWEGA